MKRLLDVWWDGRLVGHLTQDEHGDLGFGYAPAWLHDASAPQLSASLPKREEGFTRRECRPFFGGLLPEEDQRAAVAQALGISNANDFALLDRLGGDVAGAIQLLPPGEQPPPPDPRYALTPLDDAGVIRLLDDLPLRPLLAGVEGFRLSLAGAQPKLPVVLVDGAIALPAPGQPTTHILKPPVARFKGTTENEAFVMRLAAAINLDVASVEPRVAHGRTFLLIRRYDRAISDSGHVWRIHQEDFCQALGIPPDRKYASEGGPTFKDCFELLRRTSRVAGVDVLKLLDAAIFNVIVGNADAHGKNFSILHDNDGPRLAPLYDLLSTSFYPELSAGFAMKIGKRSTLGDLDAKGWKSFAADAGITQPLVRQRIGRIKDLIDSKITAVVSGIMSPGLDEAVVEALAASIGERAALCATSLSK